MLATKLDRLKCTQCSKTYKEVKLLNRHQREKHSQEQRWPCDYPGCSIDFQCLRFKTEHIKRQHAEHIAHSLEPAERPGCDFQEDMSGSIIHSSYESSYADTTPQVPTIGAPETSRLSLSLLADGNPSMPSAVNARESPSRSYYDTWAEPEAWRQSCKARTTAATGAEAQGNAHMECMQAVIKSKCDRDVDTISKIIGHAEIDDWFGEAATSGLTRKRMEDSTESIWRRRRVGTWGSEPLWVDDSTPFLRALTPVRLALAIGFLDGVVCVLSRESRPRKDLMQWWRGLPWAATADANAQWDLAITAFLSYDNSDRTLGPTWSSSMKLGIVRDALASCCPDPNNDMPGGAKWLEHAIRRGSFFGALVLLQRGADRNAALADGTTLADLALEKGQDEIAVLLLNHWLLVGPDICECFDYRHKVSGSFTSGGDAQDAALAVLVRLRLAAEAMKEKVEAWMWRPTPLQWFIDVISWAEAKICEGIDVDHEVMDARLGIKISHLLQVQLL